MSIEKEWEGRTRVYIPTCDICGEQLQPQYEWDDVFEVMKDSGWNAKKINGEWINLCEDCQKVRKGEAEQRKEA